MGDVASDADDGKNQKQNGVGFISGGDEDLGQGESNQ